MPRPVCRDHPSGRVRRDGYYGKFREFIRWECVPSNGDKPHYLKHTQLADLRPKLLGGVQHGSCDECERAWEPTDGLPSADYDKFVLREKARALVKVAEGASYKKAARGVRLRTERRRGLNPQPEAVSKDWRMAGDWVAQYADIIAERYLPAEWPMAIAVDSFDVRVPALKPDGTPLQKGKYAYSVLGAVGYPDYRRAGRLWRLSAYDRENEWAFREFFRELEGRRDVDVVVCDGSRAIRNAAAWAFPNARIYPCVWHLYNSLEVHLKRALLHSRKRALAKTVRDDMFIYPARHDHFERVFRRYRNADSSKADPRTIKGIDDIVRWRRRNRDTINLVLRSPHWPRDVTHVEEHLDMVRRHLGDRRRQFRNLPRLNALLRLVLLDLRGEADEAEWARILRENHRSHHGKPPPRRLVDGQLIQL
jgi:hypothetical protein